MKPPKGKKIAVDPDSWETPAALFDYLDREYGKMGERGFVFDAACDKTNGKIRTAPIRGLEPGTFDGLAADWPLFGWTFCNPPYSRGNLPKWTGKAAAEAARGVRSVLLLPAATSEGWFFDNVVGKAARIVFLKGRIKFEIGGQPFETARFGSCLAEYRPPDPLDYSVRPRIQFMDLRPRIRERKHHANTD